MRCPGCGWEQPVAETCVVCGVRLTQRGETAAEARRREYARSQTVSQTGGGLKESLTQPVTWPLMAVRGVVGAAACALAAYILILQEGVVLNPTAVMVVLAFGFVGLYWILSALLAISLRQFLMEMLAFLIATVGLRLNLPEAFDSEQLRRGAKSVAARLKSPPPGGAVANSPDAALGQALSGSKAVEGELVEFRKQVDVVAGEAQALLDAGVPTQPWLEWKAQADLMRSMHAKLAPEARGAADLVLRRLSALERAMEQAVGGGTGSGAVESARSALEGLK